MSMFPFRGINPSIHFPRDPSAQTPLVPGASSQFGERLDSSLQWTVGLDVSSRPNGCWRCELYLKGCASPIGAGNTLRKRGLTPEGSIAWRPGCSFVGRRVPHANTVEDEGPEAKTKDRRQKADSRRGGGLCRAGAGLVFSGLRVSVSEG